MGELRHVTDGNWQEEIGMSAELVSHVEDPPAVLFDEISGVAKGFRVLTNLFAGRRKNMTLVFRPSSTRWNSARPSPTPMPRNG